MIASRGGHLECVKHLVSEGGGDVHAVEKDSMTALMIAFRRGHLEVVKCLKSRSFSV